MRIVPTCLMISLSRFAMHCDMSCECNVSLGPFMGRRRDVSPVALDQVKPTVIDV